MISLVQINSKLFDTMRWRCDQITNITACDLSYVEVFDTSDNFIINTENHWIRFIIRNPGRTIGYFKCDAFGIINEIKIYDIDYNIYESETLIGENININELAKIEFVNNNIKINNKASKKILWFIANFIYHQNNTSEIITNQFRAGYCLHFAIILKSLFKSGEICWVAPFGHMVYIHDDIPYDIEGVNTSDCDYYIPINYIKEGIMDFTRIPGDYFNASQEYINNAIKKYKKDNNI